MRTFAIRQQEVFQPDEPLVQAIYLFHMCCPPPPVIALIKIGELLESSPIFVEISTCSNARSGRLT